MEGLCQSSALAASRAPGTARADTEPAVLLTGPGTCPCARTRTPLSSRCSCEPRRPPRSCRRSQPIRRRGRPRRRWRQSTRLAATRPCPCARTRTPPPWCGCAGTRRPARSCRRWPPNPYQGCSPIGSTCINPGLNACRDIYESPPVSLAIRSARRAGDTRAQSPSIARQTRSAP